MRNAFAEEITRLASENTRLVLLSGDIGNRLFDRFKTLCPNRFFNCGVAEANMTGVAAGMAMCGLKPVTYTIAPFNTTRCLEQIRVDLCYHNLPVIVVGTGAGLSYASLGCTHHSCEDISFLRSLPNMTVLCPGDAFEVRSLLREAMHWKGPIYFRIGKAREPTVYDKVPPLSIGKGTVLLEGKEPICLISTGNILPVAMEVAKELSIHLVSLHTVKPLDITLLTELFARFPLIYTIEEHSLVGGMGSAIAEWMIDNEITTSRLLRLGTRDEFPHRVGSQQYLRDYFNLNPKAIIQRIQNAHLGSHSGRNESSISSR